MPAKSAVGNGYHCIYRTSSTDRSPCIAFTREDTSQANGQMVPALPIGLMHIFQESMPQNLNTLKILRRDLDPSVCCKAGMSRIWHPGLPGNWITRHCMQCNTTQREV